MPLIASVMLLASVARVSATSRGAPLKERTNLAFLILFGTGDKEEADWSGRVAVTPGRVVKVDGAGFWWKDKVTGPAS